MSAAAALPLPPWLHPQGPDALLLDVQVAPQGSRTRVMGVHNGRLKVQLAAFPRGGEDNDLLVRFLASALRVARAQVEIVAGGTSARKTVRLAAVTSQRALLALARAELR